MLRINFQILFGQEGQDAHVMTQHWLALSKIEDAGVQINKDSTIWHVMYMEVILFTIQI